jgi:prolyl-tRNA synthetase
MGKEKLTQALQAKKENLEEWYPEVIQKAELADYSKVSGCIIYRPYCYSIWELIKCLVDSKLRKMGIQNAYFPLFIPESYLKKEEEHLKGFTPEVAWVTEAGGSKLDERLAIRPTSETIIYPSYSKWIKSYKDLPLRLNLWNNVVRWEFKHPKPFLRGREFLWNEGHTVFATKDEAEKEVRDILDMYYNLVKDYMALEGTKVKKTDKEKFAGAVYTTSIEYMMPDGKMIQGPDAHFDGQNFAKAFDIKFLDKNEKSEYAWQNTWAITTRMLGVMFAVHGDDKGIIMPPKLAPIQVVIIPIYKDEDKKKVLTEAKNLFEKISGKFSVNLDDREHYTPGWKFNEWELKGVPLRIEIGPKDIAKKSVVLVKRDTGEKVSINVSELEKTIVNELDKMHERLYSKSKKFLEEHTKNAKTFDEIKKLVEGNRVLVSWCGDEKCEDKVKEETGAKSVGMPFGIEAKGKCVICGKPAKHMVYFAKSY